MPAFHQIVIFFHITFNPLINFTEWQLTYWHRSIQRLIPVLPLHSLVSCYLTYFNLLSYLLKHVLGFVSCNRRLDDSRGIPYRHCRLKLSDEASRPRSQRQPSDRHNASNFSHQSSALRTGGNHVAFGAGDVAEWIELPSPSYDRPLPTCTPRSPCPRVTRSASANPLKLLPLRPLAPLSRARHIA
jgi:hypothetical protein